MVVPLHFETLPLQVLCQSIMRFVLVVRQLGVLPDEEGYLLQLIRMSIDSVYSCLLHLAQPVRASRAGLPGDGPHSLPCPC